MTPRTKKTVAGLLAAATIASSMTLFTSEAQARHWGWGGVGLGLAAGAMIGAAAASTYDGSYCRAVDVYDRFGNYIRTVRRCW